MKIINLAIILLFVAPTFCFTQATDHEGNTYKTVKIGNQTWMAENLKVITFKNGDPIYNAKTKEEWREASRENQPAWCYYKNEKTNGDKYGVLYNWYAVDDPRGLAPAGYKIPSEEDFEELLNEIGTGSASKIKSETSWANTYKNFNGSNTSGFNAKAGGLRSLQTFQDEGGNCTFWSSTPVEPKYLYSAVTLYIMISEEEAKIGKTGRSNGFYLRCLKD